MTPAANSVPDPAGLAGDVVAVIEEARGHGYSQAAAVAAAADHLLLGSHAEVVLIAAALAALIATDLNPSGVPKDLGRWIELATEVMSERDR